MPHIFVEYSKTIGEIIEIPSLILKLHNTLAQQGVNKSVIKTRSCMCRYAAVGEQEMRGHMVHVTLSLKEGRDLETKRKYGDAVFKALKGEIEDKVKACAISMEMRDMDANTYYTT
ncbi:MAG: hypothetical protein KAJ40_07515 [Alphaproteobacteria bacterium]|nr:hypothetical protein [Alphaproteobacteria bacterium]